LGVARYPEDATDLESLMIFSDLALYKTKELGRDGYQFFTSEMKQNIDADIRIEEELRLAIKNDELALYFQPQINIDDETVTGVEALLRWNHPVKGMLAPGEFLQISESAGLAQQIGCRVFDLAVKAARHWTDDGLNFGRLAINLSPQHLKKSTILDDFFGAIEKYDVEPSLLSVEFLESFILDDPNANFMDILKQLSARGVHVELDDFGTGYASLSHLSTMPIDGLKIDRSFIRQMTDDIRQRGIVASLISMSKLLKMRVVCEGVETRAQVDSIARIGNCSIQGYFVANPMSFNDATDWIRDKRNIGVFKNARDIAVIG
ncbi:MAG: GGDEF domain-containing phosphodiesterase, partial [Fimbriimonadaceae bacterium]|nr:GGDEF domain-containing phosphodiesterase [Alphaproteobacteria bacterium]